MLNLLIYFCFVLVSITALLTGHEALLNSRLDHSADLLLLIGAYFLYPLDQLVTDRLYRRA